jgi:hypothetical protein
MADEGGFLSRWAKRKQAIREGKPVEAEPLPATLAPSLPVVETAATPPPAEAPTNERPAPPTLDDVHALTPESDFRRFVSPEVAPEVKNAAMKKLFADPHFNVMDGLDVYIDDYSKPDPIPPEMLRKLASAKFLKLFDDEEEEADKEAAAASSAAAAPAAAAPAASDALTPASETGSAPTEPDPVPAASAPDGPADSPPGPGAGSPETAR